MWLGVGGERLNKEIGPTLHAAVIFVIHVVVAGLLFAVIASMATTLYAGSHFFASRIGLPPLVTEGLEFLEIFLFLVDGACFLFLIGVEGLKFCTRIWASRKELDDD